MDKRNHNQQNCLIFDENQSNYNLLKRMVQSFHLNPVNFERLETALKYLETEPANLVIIDTDYLRNTTPGEVTAHIKGLKPQCVVMWVCAHKPGKGEGEEVKPDIILEKPFGIMLFQQVLTPYIFSQSIPGHKNSVN